VLRAVCCVQSKILRVKGLGLKSTGNRKRPLDAMAWSLSSDLKIAVKVRQPYYITAACTDGTAPLLAVQPQGIDFQGCSAIWVLIACVRKSCLYCILSFTCAYSCRPLCHHTWALGN
jgi:hypothetical protein